MPTVLLVQGSLRKGGFNAQLQAEIEGLLKGKAEVKVLDYEGLPYMNQDLEKPELELIAHLRESFRDADGIWFVTPQYNGSFPGHIKTLVDWMSRPVPGKGMDSVAIAGAKVTVSGAGGKTATQPMRDALNALLKFVRADVMDTPQTGIALPGESWASGKLILSEEDKAQLEAQVEAFLKFIV